MQFILNKNVFVFEKSHYQQLYGSAMGSPSACAYACLFMGKFEHDHVFNNNTYRQYIKHFSRYIDDIYMIWSGEIETLRDFQNYLNSRVESISFSMEMDQNSIHFLDVEIIKLKKKLKTTIYRKPTDKNDLLRFESHHPAPLKRKPIVQIETQMQLRGRLRCSEPQHA